MLPVQPPKSSYVLDIVLFLGGAIQCQTICLLVLAVVFHRSYTFKYVWEKQDDVMLETPPLGLCSVWEKSKLTSSECLLRFYVYTHTHVYTEHVHNMCIYTLIYFLLLLPCFAFSSLYGNSNSGAHTQLESVLAKLKQTVALHWTGDPNQHPTERKCWDILG